VGSHGFILSSGSNILQAQVHKVPVGTHNGGKLPIEEIFAIGLQLCNVLDYLHTRQPPIIFRDLKPGNIMLTPDRHVYLIDFGIARHFKQGQKHDTVAMGSSGYAAPEQYGTAQSTAQTDIYALAVVLHQLYTGEDPSERPFFLSSIEDPQIPASRSLQALLQQMHATDPQQRPATIREVRNVLHDLAQYGWQKGTVPPRQDTFFATKGTALSSTAPYEILELFVKSDVQLVGQCEKHLRTLGQALDRPFIFHRGIEDLTGYLIEKSWTERIQTASLILMFLSPDFLANDDLFPRAKGIAKSVQGLEWTPKTGSDALLMIMMKPLKREELADAGDQNWPFHTFDA
jgi:serine/threonine protein kinase